MRKAIQLCVTVACAFALVNCGSSSSNNGGTDGGTDAGTDGGTDGGVTLTGSGAAALQILPQAGAVLQAAGSPAANLGDMTKFRVDLIDPVKFLLNFGNESAARMGDSPVTPTATTANHADYQVTNIDTSSLAVPSQTPGLVVNVLDTETPARQTTTTSTGVIALVAPTTAGGPYTFPPGNNLAADAPAFIIPDAFASILGSLLSPALTSAQLGQAGYILAITINRTTGQPVGGATVAPIANHTVTYPTLGQTGLTAGTATDPQLGLVVVTGPASTLANPVIQISASTSTLPACASATATNCLAPAFAGLTNNIAFVAPIVKH